VTDLDHEHDQPVILDIANDPVVANPVAPVLAELGSLKAICYLSRIVEPRDTLFEKATNALAGGEV
jgi:hypothetical protein